MQIYPNETLNIQLLKELNKVGLMFLTIWLDSFRDSPVFLAVFTICRRRAHCRLGIWDGSFLRIFLKRKNVPVNFWGFHCWVRHALGLVLAVNPWGSPLHSAGSSRLGWYLCWDGRSFPGIFLLLSPSAGARSTFIGPDPVLDKSQNAISRWLIDFWSQSVFRFGDLKSINDFVWQGTLSSKNCGVFK